MSIVIVSIIIITIVLLSVVVCIVLQHSSHWTNTFPSTDKPLPVAAYQSVPQHCSTRACQGEGRAYHCNSLPSALEPRSDFDSSLKFLQSLKLITSLHNCGKNAFSIIIIIIITMTITIITSIIIIITTIIIIIIILVSF